MTEQRLESLLRSAKPEAKDLSPLSPEASTRILHAALRANRRPKGGGWVGMPWRVAAGAVAFGMMAFVFLPQTLVQEETVANPIPSTTPVQIVDNTQVKSTTPGSPAGKKNVPSVSGAGTQHSVPSPLPKVFHPKHMLAHQSVSHREAAPAQSTPVVPVKQTATPETDPDSGMYVSVSGVNSLPPADQSDEGLIVTVAKDVPDSVPGVAEAASLQAVSVPQDSVATDTPVAEQVVPVWAHAHVESGADSTVTLTALR